MSDSCHPHGTRGALTIYIDCERMRHPNTGIFEYCRRLAEAVCAQTAPSERLVAYRPELPPGVLPPSVGVSPHRHLHKFLGVPAEDAAVWHATYQKTRYLPRRKVPVVLTVHDLNFLYEDKSPRSVERNKEMVRRNARRADVVVAISEYVARDIRTRLGVDPGKVRVVHNGVDRIDLRERVRPLHVPARPFLFALGPTIPKKNFATLPALLPGNDMELVIAGFTEEPYLGEIMGAARRFGVEERVHAVGPVGEGEKAWYYAHCAAFAFPSLAEGFGLPVLEAMLFGKPVFLSRRTSLPEIGGDLAYYFDDNFDPRTMNELFNSAMAAPPDAAGSCAMVERARGFSWEKAARAYLGIYREILAKETLS